MNLLFEAVGSPAWPTLLPFLRPIARRIVALEIDPLVAAARLVDRCHLVPRYATLRDPEPLLRLCRDERIDLAFPSVHEGLPLWARHIGEFEKNGTTVVLSPPETIAWCHDKWETYGFFRRHGIPTPETSLSHEFELLKPRVGRGGDGIRRAAPGSETRMEGLVSQRLLGGTELSVDVLCDRRGCAVYKVQRERLAVCSGISVRGRVVRHAEVDRLVDRVLAASPFFGIINLQCFREGESVLFTEVNPRIPGGLSLSLAATENWFAVLLKILAGEPIRPVATRRGLLVARHWVDVFVDPASLAAETCGSAAGEGGPWSDESASSS